MIKRVFDVAASLAGLIVLAPMLLAIAVAVRLESSGPALFRQVRVGRGGRLFKVLKFRTMKAVSAGQGRLVTVGADPRITKLGHFLRRSKVDELPQLINVIRGDMSLVGPRPEVPEYMSRYTPEQRQVILSVRPGLTDFAAIEFSDEAKILGHAADPDQAYTTIVMPRKYALYERYVNENSFALDIKLIILTILKILRT